MEIIDILGYALIISGALICFIAAVGMLRFRDFYSKTHAAGLNDVFGCVLILVGIIFLSGLNYFSMKIILLILITIIVSPTSTFILARLKTIIGDKDE